MLIIYKVEFYLMRVMNIFSITFVEFFDEIKLSRTGTILEMKKEKFTKKERKIFHLISQFL